jgi:hypothetical protein
MKRKYRNGNRPVKEGGGGGVEILERKDETLRKEIKL